MILRAHPAASLAWFAIAMVASWYPARRATRVDPITALNSSDLRAHPAASLAGIAIAMVASWYPARRAPRVDPMTALNYE